MLQTEFAEGVVEFLLMQFIIRNRIVFMTQAFAFLMSSDVGCLSCFEQNFQELEDWHSQGCKLTPTYDTDLEPNSTTRTPATNTSYEHHQRPKSCHPTSCRVKNRDVGLWHCDVAKLL